MSYDAFPPNGFDWADGKDIRPGTPTAASAVISNPIDIATLGMLEEYPNSPEIERGEQATFRHSFKCDWETGKLIISALGRGTWVQDSNGFVFRILTTQLNREKGNLATLITTAEAISFDNPPDEFDVEDVEINPEIEKHPLWLVLVGDNLFNFPYNLQLVSGSLQRVDPAQKDGLEIIEICKQAAAASSVLAANDILATLNTDSIKMDWQQYDSSGNPTIKVTAAQVIALAKALYRRYQRGETTFYLSGYKVVWSQYYWGPALMVPGGFIEDPVYEGALPPYFWSTDQTSAGQNILTTNAVALNPLIYGNGISWLRLCDKEAYSRTWFKLTKTWIGGPLGHWDALLYPAIHHE